MKFSHAQNSFWLLQMVQLVYLALVDLFGTSPKSWVRFGPLNKSFSAIHTLHASLTNQENIIKGMKSQRNRYFGMRIWAINFMLPWFISIIRIWNIPYADFGGQITRSQQVWIRRMKYNWPTCTRMSRKCFDQFTIVYLYNMYVMITSRGSRIFSISRKWNCICRSCRRRELSTKSCLVLNEFVFLWLENSFLSDVITINVQPRIGRIM